MRVLQLCAVDFTAERFLLPLIEFLRERACEVVTACSPGEGFERLRARGLQMHALPIRRSYDLLSHLRSIEELTAFLRRERFDVIHVHTPVAALIGRIAATRAKVPIRFYTAHGFYFHDRMNPLLYRAHVALERFGARRCDFIFTQSEEDCVTAIREKIIDESRILTIGNGIDLQRFSRQSISQDQRQQLCDELGIKPSDRVIAIIGRLVPEKGYRELFEAIASLKLQFPTLRLLVIGQALPSDRQVLHPPESLRDSIIFAGLRQEVPALLSLAEIFTLPSWREGMPRSVIEAMAMELPVVASNIRGCREIVVDGQTGLLVPAQNPSKLAQALRDLLSQPSKARTFGLAGREVAERNHNERDVLERQWQVYRRFLSQLA